MLSLEKAILSYGGFWKHDIIDFCYLSNPYFPTKKFNKKLLQDANKLINSYPSGQNVICESCSKYFNIDKDKIIVGNGASELISCYIRSINGLDGFIFPSFEEYYNRCQRGESVIFETCYEKGFKYTEDDIITFIAQNNIKNIIIINPDIPSGNLIKKNGMLKILDFCQEKKIHVLIDESFMDFCDESNSFLQNDILSKYTYLTIVKSLSKSYGIPGLRLGVLFTGNLQLRERVYKKTSIWNINSFAERFLDIISEYKVEYKKSCDKIKNDRDLFFKELFKIKDIKPYESNGNFIMVEILNGFTCKDLQSFLYNKKKILIKDLSNKHGFNGKQFIRLSVKSKDDNNVLIKEIGKFFHDTRTEI